MDNHEVDPKVKQQLDELWENSEDKLEETLDLFNQAADHI